MAETIEEKATSSEVIGPKFVNPNDLPPEALSDPDYRLKKLQQEYGGEYKISCSKCHHCR